MDEPFRSVRAPQGAWSDLLVATLLLAAGILPVLTVGLALLVEVPAEASQPGPDPLLSCLRAQHAAALPPAARRAP